MEDREGAGHSGGYGDAQVLWDKPVGTRGHSVGRNLKNSCVISDRRDLGACPDITSLQLIIIFFLPGGSC